MDIIKISDRTMRAGEAPEALNLSFKGKIELAKLLDKLGVSVIELEGIKKEKADMLLIKSIAAAVKDAEVAVPSGMKAEEIEKVWSALKDAKNPRLQIEIPVSTVQMEYIYHTKPAKMKEAVATAIAECKKYTDNVEFIAQDATRADEAFLYEIIGAAIKAGATTVTLCNTTGNMMPVEVAGFINNIKKNVDGIDDIVLGFLCSDELFMADTCSVIAAKNGVREIKCSAYPTGNASLEKIARIIAGRGDSFGVSTSVAISRINRTMNQIKWVCSPDKAEKAPHLFDGDESNDEVFLSCHDPKEEVIKVVRSLGYDLSEEDEAAVWEAFKNISGKKEQIGAKEIDALVASTALQVPATYKLKNYVVNSGNNISAMAHIQLTKNDEEIEGIGKGDGPIDAVFSTLEGILGNHYELDDFQIRSITEGREAMGEAIVRLSSDGKVYAGRGISTDIVASSIRAYLNALNKFVYEEAE